MRDIAELKRATTALIQTEHDQRVAAQPHAQMKAAILDAYDALAADAPTLADVCSLRDVAATIRESAEHVLAVALAREGIIASPEKIARLAKELGNNAAQCLSTLAVTVVQEAA